MRVITTAVVLLCVRAASAAPTFEKQPSPSRVFEGIRAGMSLDEAKPKLTSFAWDESYRDAAARKRLVAPAGDGAKYYVLVTNDTIARIGIEAPEQGLEAKLTRLWGRPMHLKNTANEALTSWAKGTWRVDLSCRGTLCRLAFQESLPARYFGHAVAPPGALASVMPGMSRAQLEGISPQHATGADVPAGFEDVHVKVDVSKAGVVRSVVIVGLPANAQELATTAWGEPVTTDRGPMWTGERGWRAIYDAELRAIELIPHVTASLFLGSGPGIQAFARPVLGATEDQIAAAYPTFTRTPKAATLALPGIERTAPTNVALTFDKQTKRATGVAFELPYADAAGRAELVKLLASKWGKPAAKSSRVLSFPTGKLLRIEATDTGRALQLQLAIQ